MKWITVSVPARMRLTTGEIRSEVQVMILRTDFITEVISQFPVENTQRVVLNGEVVEQKEGCVITYNSRQITVLQSVQEVYQKLRQAGE